jgi:hypothetical protein
MELAFEPVRAAIASARPLFPWLRTCGSPSWKQCQRCCSFRLLPRGIGCLCLYLFLPPPGGDPGFHAVFSTPPPRVSTPGNPKRQRPLPRFSPSPGTCVMNPLLLQSVYATLLEIGLALRHMHSLHLVHCDLKPQNVLLKTAPRDPRGFMAKLSDFGLAKTMAHDEDGQLVIDEAVASG